MGRHKDRWGLARGSGLPPICTSVRKCSVAVPDELEGFQLQFYFFWRLGSVWNERRETHWGVCLCDGLRRQDFQTAFCDKAHLHTKLHRTLRRAASAVARAK